MGQPIVVVEKPSVNRGIVRFETNRALTGMGHEHYAAGEEVRGNRPPDELARRLLARENVHGVHVNGSVVTVDLAKGHSSEGLKEVIEDLYTFYPETAETEAEAETETEAEAEADASPEGDLGDGAAAPETAADPGSEVDESADDAPAPVHEPAVPAEEASAETVDEETVADESADDAADEQAEATAEG
jgi:hypothetical protein